MMPFLTMASVRAELVFAKDNGACGIFMRAHETERRLTDSYFHPLFEFAGEFDMPICVHSASGSHTISEFFGEDNFGKFFPDSPKRNAAIGARSGARRAHKEGWCSLVQRKVGGEFQYIAQRK